MILVSEAGKKVFFLSFHILLYCVDVLFLGTDIALIIKIMKYIINKEMYRYSGQIQEK